MSTFRNPGCYACCFGEHEEASPWEPLHILIVLSPMRARTVAGDGWSNADAGGTAGPFTALIPGWSFADSPARLVLKKIRRPA